MLRYLTAGESHGKGILAILEGLPAGLKLDTVCIDKELKRRQSGYGRGKRMQIEKDRARILSGVKGGITLGSPVSLFIENKDFKIDKMHRVNCARPGHADLCGVLKYGFSDIRQVLERASARNTVATVAVGSICKMFLNKFGIRIKSNVLSVGGKKDVKDIKDTITEAIKQGDTLGGIFEVCARGVPVGLGSYVHPDKRLDARLAGGIISIPGIKAVEIGLGFGYADRFGSEVHDQIYCKKNESSHGFYRKTNNAGGIEGGISNGEEIVLRACMKPISTLMKPLDSVNIDSGKPAKAAVERSDICVVEAAGVISESVVAFVLADAFLEKFGTDSLSDIKESYKNYLKRIS